MKLKDIRRILYKAWMAFAHALAVINTTLILTIVYVILMGPMWLVMKVRRRDLLDRTIENAQSYWKPKDPIQHTMEQSRRQF